VRKSESELPTHYLSLRKTNKRAGRIWRVRLAHPCASIKKDGTRYYTIILDRNQHPGVHFVLDVPEERLRLILPPPAIVRMLLDRYGLYVRKEQGKPIYHLYRRERAMEDTPHRWSQEDVVTVDEETLLDETCLRAKIEDALRPEHLPPLG